MQLLKDKICIITGSGKGFGKDIAKLFYKQGAKLALITRSQKDVDLLKKEFHESGSRVMFFCGDVTHADIVADFVNKVISKFGSIDILVNNAGIRFRKKFLETNLDDFNNVINANVSSMFILCQAVIPHMLKSRRGKIINMSSIAGTLGLPDLSCYVTSKSAIIGLTKSLAVEFAEKNIQINALAPGFCKTSYFDDFRKKTDLYDFTVERTPMKRWGESKEIADVCLFLASNLSNFMTGEVINVDGGWSAS